MGNGCSPERKGAFVVVVRVNQALTLLLLLLNS